ncbi:RNA polymerase sigma factor [Pontibacter anaerobius]|uniref:Sigma-70 family RNA polymerase sigma factor n=1 Tax=Pontibacter anaerobius TaxID=2993940 RepID=A0ABT3RGF7_9BACT|nr:sigma-70 family RNA polymerase sigma factor [Pontibacter anaerobius]MCX2740909.1 sigma-70 family RNA polymerase sigma factor [Pontibacter anaerobius]
MSGIDLQGETEKSLVTALRQGRQEMLGKLYDAYAPVMMGVISRIVRDPEVAEEALKETFVAIWTRIGMYDSSKERLLTWGLAIARGIALQAIKTDKYKAIVEAHTEGVKNGYPKNKPATLPDTEIKKQDLCTLAPLEKTILESLYLKGRTCAETAGELNMSVEEVREILKKAFVHLKAEKSV